MKKIAIIPARLGSSRFPGKPLAAINGRPMIEHVYTRVKMSDELDEVFVATCDSEIAEFIRSIGGKAIMTASTHERCSDRCAEAMLKIEESIGHELEIVVMVQGDEPLTVPEMVEASMSPLLSDPAVQLTNLYTRLETLGELHDANEVKVVVDHSENALYFSREPLPSLKKLSLNQAALASSTTLAEVSKLSGEPFKAYKQVCVISFRRDYLLYFNQLTETPLERVESVDMLRVLEHGESVKMVYTDAKTKAVDVPEDISVVENLMDEICV